ncbi:hypothetical protein [Spirosoma flavum]|uniref:DUF2147 domain-containing protein n=1 Tax=Spirosoma flavum TaxID=2048557 RepID=A0ABW6AJZ4_9BACT
MTLKTLFLSIAVITAFVSVAKAQTSSSDSLTTIVGKWSGTFEGASSGKFELVVNQDSNHKLIGQIIMLPGDGSRLPIDLQTIVWQKGKLSATYKDPADGDDDVSFTGDYTSSALKGTWKSDGGQASGTWQVTRQ